MIHFLQSFFDRETQSVIGMGTIGTIVGSITLSGIVAVLTGLYVLVKLIKQLRDWKRPDKD